MIYRWFPFTSLFKRVILQSNQTWAVPNIVSLNLTYIWTVPNLRCMCHRVFDITKTEIDRNRVWNRIMMKYGKYTYIYIHIYASISLSLSISLSTTVCLFWEGDSNSSMPLFFSWRTWLSWGKTAWYHPWLVFWHIGNFKFLGIG